MQDTSTIPLDTWLHEPADTQSKAKCSAAACHFTFEAHAVGGLMLVTSFGDKTDSNTLAKLVDKWQQDRENGHGERGNS
jgi:hypothetical protein